MVCKEISLFKIQKSQDGVQYGVKEQSKSLGFLGVLEWPAVRLILSKGDDLKFHVSINVFQSNINANGKKSL